MIVNKTKVKTITPTIKTGAYVSGRVLGTAFDLTELCGGGGGGVILQLLITDAANQKKALKLYLFDDVPPTKINDDDFATGLVIADINNLVAMIDIAAADYVTLNSLAYQIVGAPPDTDKYSIAHGTGKLWGILVTNDTPTYGATNALVLKFTAWKD